MKNRISDVIDNKGEFVIYWRSECEQYFYNLEKCSIPYSA